MKTAAALSAPRVRVLSHSDLLTIVCELQADVRDLARRLDQSEREFARAHRAGAISPETAGRRRIPLEEAGRRGLLPAGRCSRTVRGWMATAESRAMWKTDLFARRVGNRIEIDLDGLEKWRTEMTAPTSPAWPKSWKRPT